MTPAEAAALAASHSDGLMTAKELRGGHWIQLAVLDAHDRGVVAGASRMVAEAIDKLGSSLRDAIEQQTEALVSAMDRRA